MRVLIADDDRLLAVLLAQLVRECDHEVVATVTGGGLAVIRSYVEHKPDVVLLDILMPRCNGFTVCHALRSRDPEAKVIFISGQYESGHPNVKSSGATAYLRKPLLLEELRATLASMGAKNPPLKALPPHAAMAGEVPAISAAA
jgi:two-component system chemotaxis response regulator CheY